MSGKSQGISLKVGEKLNVSKKSGKSEILGVHIKYVLLKFHFSLTSFKLLLLLFSNIKIFLCIIFTDMNCLVLVEYCS